MNTIKGSPRGTSRKTAIIVGVLYIIGTVTGVLSLVFAGPILDDPDYLLKVSANENQITTGALLVLMMGLALALVPVMMFPILKKHHEGLAVGYVVFRGALEAVCYIGMSISWLLLIVVSQEYVQAGASDASYFQTFYHFKFGESRTKDILRIVWIFQIITPDSNRVSYVLRIIVDIRESCMVNITVIAIKTVIGRIFAANGI